jgi:hypothetical protein
MIEIDEIKRQLRARRISEISAETGIHRNTLARLRDRDDYNPTYYLLARLAAYFENGPRP